MLERFRDFFIDVKIVSHLICSVVNRVYLDYTIEEVGPTKGARL